MCFLLPKGDLNSVWNQIVPVPENFLTIFYCVHPEMEEFISLGFLIVCAYHFNRLYSNCHIYIYIYVFHGGLGGKV